MQQLELMQGMTDSQRMLFQTRYQATVKSPGVALLLTLFLGGLGAHRFYLEDAKTGIWYILFVWTLIPSLIALFELFVVMERTRNYNATRAREIAAETQALTRSG